MIQYDDSLIDEMLWSSIEHSKEAGDFDAYTDHKPEGAQHLAAAHERFIALANGELLLTPEFSAAIERVRSLAEQGNPTALFHMGKFYANGTGVKPDPLEAWTWYEKAVAAGELRAFCNLALMALEGRGVDEDKGLAYKLLKQASESGEPLATTYLGLMMINGDACAQDIEGGLALMERGYRDGMPGAAGMLTRLYFDKAFSHNDPELGHQWLEEAAKVDPSLRVSLGRYLITTETDHKDPVRGMAELEGAFVAGQMAAAEIMGQIYEDGNGIPKDLAKAHHWYEQGAKNKHSNCMIRLALHILNLVGEARDTSAARAWLEEAWRLGNIRAAIYLGKMYSFGDGVEKSDEESFRWHERGALRNDPDAAFICGWMYEIGKGTEENRKLAEKCYRVAAEAGHDQAQLFLGRFYLKGEDNHKRGAEGVRWLLSATELGNSEAMMTLGSVYLNGIGVIKNAAEGFRWVQKAAEAGNVDGESRLAEMLLSGEGVESNKSEAIAWCQKAAQHGHAFAQGMLGFLYMVGNGLEKNEDEAFKWSQMSALQGDTAGQWVLAECYLWGRGTPKDTVKAREWLVKSAKSGYFRSQRRLAEIYFYGMDVERNYPEAGRWASLAADQGDAEAQTIVGEMFIFGYGVETDPAAGAKWLMEAANQDHPKAQGLLGVMHAEGLGVKRDWITALKWLKRAAEQEDERALDFLKENGIDYKPGQGTQSKRRLSPDQPVAKNPEFDVTIIPGQWTTRISDPEMDVLTVFDADGTYRAEGMSEGMDTWHYKGRWAVEGNKLLWDVEESDMPFPFDGDMDDVVMSISQEQIVTQDAEGKITTYCKVESDDAQKKSKPTEKVVRLSVLSGNKLGA